MPVHVGGMGGGKNDLRSGGARTLSEERQQGTRHPEAHQDFA
jgi:hypothetical protein